MHTKSEMGKFLVHQNNSKVANSPNLQQKIFLYDDLQRQGQFGLITKLLMAKIQNFNPFASQISAKNQNLLFFENQLGTYKNQDQIINTAPIFNEFSFIKIRYLARLQEAEQIDFVLNQYSLFLHENNIHQVIFPTTKKLDNQAKFDRELLVIRSLIDNHKQLEHFRYQTARYFGIHRMKQINQTWQLLWRQKYLPKQQNFLVNVQSVLNKNNAILEIPIKQKLQHLRQELSNTYQTNKILLSNDPEGQE